MTITLPSRDRRATHPRRPRPAETALGVSVAAHLALAALLVVDFASRPAPTMDLRAAPPIMLTLEPPATPPRPAPSEEALGKTSPTEPARATPAIALKVELRPAIQTLATALPLPSPTDRAATPPGATSSETPATTRAAAPPPPSAPPGARPSGAAQSTWAGRVMARLDSVKRYPASARVRRAEGVAHIRFTMDRRGRVGSVSLEQSSGHHDLDEAAISAVRRAQPLPRPPDDVAGDPVELVVQVEFDMS